MSDDASIPAAPRRPRRAVLAAALGGVGAFVASAFGRAVPRTDAAAGGNLILGANNSAGSSQTVLTSTAGGAAFTLKDSTPNGTGMFGWSSAATGTGRGLYGRVDSISGYGVQANQTVGDYNGPGAAIHATSPGVAVRAVGTKAVWASSTGGVAVYAEATGGTGVYATSSSAGPAIYGVGSGTHGAIINSNTATAVQTHSDSGHAVNASSGSGDGVHAISTLGIGVYGNSSFNWSGYFGIDARVENDFQVGGNASVAGSLSKGGGSFRIDHPLDPANKYLSHSFVESPDMKNVYDGVARLDDAGEATVSMPAWFDALNRDVRYQLTALDASMPNLFVKARLADGRFTIGGGVPDREVSWQVTGIRQDAWANANRIKVEEAKTGAERGTYLHPEVHGQPVSKRVPAKHPIPAPAEG